MMEEVGIAFALNAEEVLLAGSFCVGLMNECDDLDT